MRQLDHVAVDQAAELQGLDHISLGPLQLDVDVECRGEVLDEESAELPQLDDGGVGGVMRIALGRPPQAEWEGVMPTQEGKVLRFNSRPRYPHCRYC